MSRTLLMISLAVVSAAVLISFSSGPRPSGNSDYAVNDEYLKPGDIDQQDWNDCVQKESSKWGGRCLNYGHNDEMYSVNLVNTCDQMVDLMCCVQRTNGQWHCFYRMDMKKSDTLNAYACIGSGKYLKWVRKSGDVTTEFPTRDEVNRQY